MRRWERARTCAQRVSSKGGSVLLSTSFKRVRQVYGRFPHELVKIRLEKPHIYKRTVATENCASSVGVKISVEFIFRESAFVETICIYQTV